MIASPVCITYLVLAHAKPEQFKRLATVLTREGDRVVTHVDAVVDQTEFESAVAELGDRVLFTPARHNVRWGGFGSVDAELSVLRHALVVAPADYYILLSAVDYPIRPRSTLIEHLQSDSVYMESWPMPDGAHNKPMKRLRCFYFPTKNRNNLAANVLNKVILAHIPCRNVRKGLGGRRPYGGSQWWAMPHAWAERVLQFAEEKARFMAFFRRSRNPDEMIFQTIVENLPGPRPEIRPPLTFADWSPGRRESGGTAPATLVSDDVPSLRRRAAFFARKFDTDRDPWVLDLVDAQLLRE